MIPQKIDYKDEAERIFYSAYNSVRQSSQKSGITQLDVELTTEYCGIVAELEVDYCFDIDEEVPFGDNDYILTGRSITEVYARVIDAQYYDEDGNEYPVDINLLQDEIDKLNFCETI